MPPIKNPECLTVGLAQMAPVWLNREGTTNKMLTFIQEAADKGCHIVAFGEALLPGYPFWTELTDGAKFNSSIQKEIHAFYMSQSIRISKGHLDALTGVCKKNKIATVFGFIEQAEDRGHHSLYCSLAHINREGECLYVHRKLMPTYEERLSWSIGDGHGLQVHPLGNFSVGALNCWENWMPLVRSALYGLGEDFHIAIWPGNLHNTTDITRFIAKESRSYVLSVSGLMRKEDIASSLPHADLILKNCPPVLANGGSCLAAPDGSWMIEPQPPVEQLFVATIDHERVRQERQNLDVSGHYARPDVVRLTVDRRRQSNLDLIA